MSVAEASAAIEHALTQIDANLDLSALNATQRLRDALDLDSFDFLALIEQLHGLIAIDIPEADDPQVETLDALVRYRVERGV